MRNPVGFVKLKSLEVAQISSGKNRAVVGVTDDSARTIFCASQGGIIATRPSSGTSASSKDAAISPKVEITLADVMAVTEVVEPFTIPASV
jgi:ribosomal protein S11